jgi:hypothetical protein
MISSFICLWKIEIWMFLIFDYWIKCCSGRSMLPSIRTFSSSQHVFDRRRSFTSLVSCNKQPVWRPSAARHLVCLYTYYIDKTGRRRKPVRTRALSRPAGSSEKLLITIYQEVNDLHWSNTCCDDENERTGGNTSLPEQHFFLIKNDKCTINMCKT